MPLLTHTLCHTPFTHPNHPLSPPPLVGFINGVGLTKAEQRAQQVIAQQSFEGNGDYSC